MSSHQEEHEVYPYNEGNELTHAMKAVETQLDDKTSGKSNARASQSFTITLAFSR